VVEQFHHVARLGDLPTVHYRHRIAVFEHDGDVVGDHQHADLPIILQVVDVVEDLVLHDHVERGRRLVSDDEARLQEQRKRDDRSLLHPAGKLMGVVVDAGLREADDVEQFAEPLHRFVLRHVGVVLRHLDRLLAQFHHRVEAVHR